MLPKRFLKLSKTWFKGWETWFGAFKIQNKWLCRSPKVAKHALLCPRVYKTVSTSQYPNSCRWLTVNGRCSSYILTKFLWMPLAPTITIRQILKVKILFTLVMPIQLYIWIVTNSNLASIVSGNKVKSKWFLINC